MSTECQGECYEAGCLRAQIARLTEERDKARAKVGEVSRDNDRLRSALFAYRADNYRLRELLEAAEFWLEHTPQEERTIGMLKVLGRICTELAGSLEPPGLSEVPPVSAMRWVADTVERGDSELDCSLEEVNAVIRWLRAWAERLEEIKDND